MFTLKKMLVAALTVFTLGTAGTAMARDHHADLRFDGARHPYAVQVDHRRYDRHDRYHRHYRGPSRYEHHRRWDRPRHYSRHHRYDRHRYYNRWHRDSRYVW